MSDISITFEAASGSNKDVAVYLALNGSVIASSKKTAKVSSNELAPPAVISVSVGVFDLATLHWLWRNGN